MHSQDIIDEFFIQDGELMPNGRIKRSILLAIIDDLEFCILLHRRWKNANLTTKQKAHLRTIMPSVAVASLFCTAVDLLARVYYKKAPGIGKSGTFFTTTVVEWFGLSQTEAEELWRLRNSILHTYSLAQGQILVQFGHGRIVRQNTNGYWEFYLHAMYSYLRTAKSNLYTHLSQENLPDKQQTVAYLTNHGFFYTR